jgi:hypothetical protein
MGYGKNLLSSLTVPMTVGESLALRGKTIGRKGLLKRGGQYYINAFTAALNEAKQVIDNGEKTCFLDMAHNRHPLLVCGQKRTLLHPHVQNRKYTATLPIKA